MARSFEKYSIAELTVDDGIAKRRRPKIYTEIGLSKAITYSTDEFSKISLNNSLHNLTVHICQPNTHVCSYYKESSQYSQIEGFF